MKKQGFDILKGQRIMSYEQWDNEAQYFNFQTENKNYCLNIEDDSYGCNDSHAYLSSINNIDNILNQEIIEVTEESDSYGAEITLRTRENACVIQIVHDHNGYYGFSYEVNET